MEHLDFKIVVEPKDSQSFTIILVASSRQEKSAWTSDISQACPPAFTIFFYLFTKPFIFFYPLWFKISIYILPFFPQCIDNIRCNGLMMNAFEDNSKVTVPQMIKYEFYCNALLRTFNNQGIVKIFFML